ncbi:hypothetical protein Mapa_005060 [Marchantia paleacea]|nr:hypothetical protein Mapa_005060 [Marchantia paleacea]
MITNQRGGCTNYDNVYSNSFIDDQSQEGVYTYRSGSDDHGLFSDSFHDQMFVHNFRDNDHLMTSVC